ncbi:MAG TPA: response regulator [Thermomicrobiaceae bacterium]|nr:response regulator [Thermomicrobiaceae bacterium]
MSDSTLLVEDDAQLRGILQRSLERRGHPVRVAATGAAARALLTAEPADLVLLDINLPDETGWEVLRWLRERPGRQPRVVVLTAGASARSRVADLKPDAVLLKPFPIEALLRLVEGDEGQVAD